MLNLNDELEKAKVVIEVSIPFLNVKVTGNDLNQVLNIVLNRVGEIEKTAQEISLKQESLTSVASTPLLKIAKNIGVEVTEIVNLLEEKDGTISLKLGLSSNPSLKYMDAVRILLFALTSGYSKTEISKEELKPLLQFAGFDIGVLSQYVNALEKVNELIKQNGSVRLTRPGIEEGRNAIRNYLGKLKGGTAK